MKYKFKGRRALDLTPWTLIMSSLAKTPAANSQYTIEEHEIVLTKQHLNPREFWPDFDANKFKVRIDSMITYNRCARAHRKFIHHLGSKLAPPTASIFLTSTTGYTYPEGSWFCSPDAGPPSKKIAALHHYRRSSCTPRRPPSMATDVTYRAELELLRSSLDVAELSD